MAAKYMNFVGSKFVSSTSSDTVDVFNPSTGDLICTVPNSSQADVEFAIAAAKSAQPSWAKMPAVERGRALHAIATQIRKEASSIARIISEEQGKILSLAEVEVSFTADYFDYMAEWARRIEGEILQSDRADETILLFRKPIGVVAGILPWNFPFFLIVRKAAPALVTGNTIVLKPSEETPHNAVKFCEILQKISLPAGVINMVHGRGATTGETLASSPHIGMISFTGSVQTGSKIMQCASQNVTKVNLELGGKAPAIVMDDADLTFAVSAIKASRIINSGQVCNCVERVYVHARVADAFTEQLTKAMEDTKFGDPLSQPDVAYGPLINSAGLEKVDALVRGAILEGAIVTTGGRRVEGGKGNFYEPTVLRNCRQEMEIVQKEIFGPVIPVIPVDSLEQAITYANDSEYGLTSSIYTQNLNSALRACQDLNFGKTYINRENFEAMQGFHAGWRRSGIGGADGKHGLYEYMQTQVVYLQRY